MALSLISALSLSAVAAENDGPGGPSAPVISQSGTLDTWLDAEGNEVSEGTGTKYTTNLLTDKNIGSWTGVQAFKYRSAISMLNGSVDKTNSVYALAGKSLSDTQADGLTMTTTTPGYSALIARDSDYTLKNANIHMNTASDGKDVNDFAGYGAAVAAYGDSTVTIEDSTINTTGVAKAATFADDGADLIVKNSKLGVNGGNIYKEYKSTANQAYMINPPWVLGISGSARTTNVMGEGTTGTYVDTDIYAKDWGAVSIDTGSNMKLTLINSDVTVDGSGYGAYAIGDGTEEYFLGTDFDVQTYAAILTGADVTLASYTGGESVDITKITDGSKVATVSSKEVADGTVVPSTVKSDNFGFMFHHNAPTGTNNLYLEEGTTVETGNAAFLVKKVNNNIHVDGAKISSEDGVLLQMIDNDDDMVGAYMDETFGMPTFNYTFSEKDGWSSTWGTEVKDSGWVTNADFTDIDLDGDVYNGTGYTANGAQTLNLSLGKDASLTGAIASTEIQHKDKSFTYYDESKGYDAATAAAAADKLGHVINQVHYNGENDVNVELTDNAVWTVDGTSLVTKLTIGADASVVYDKAYNADGNEITLEAGKTYEHVTVEGTAKDIEDPDGNTGSGNQDNDNTPNDEDQKPTIPDADGNDGDGEPNAGNTNTGNKPDTENGSGSETTTTTVAKTNDPFAISTTVIALAAAAVGITAVGLFSRKRRLN